MTRIKREEQLQYLPDWTWELARLAAETFHSLLGTLPLAAPGVWTEINTMKNRTNECLGGAEGGGWGEGETG